MPPPPCKCPTNVTATPGVASALVSWTLADDPSVTGYRIYCIPTDKKVHTVGPTATSATITGLKNGIPYDFRVHSICPTGMSSSTLPAAPNAQCAAPKLTVARTLNSSGVVIPGSISLTWTAVFPKNSNNLQYHFEGDADGGAPWDAHYAADYEQPIVGGYIPTPPNPLIVTGLTLGRLYTISFMVQTDSSASPSTTATIVPASLPNPPTNFGGSPALLSAGLGWDMNPLSSTGPVVTEYSGGMPVTGYVITYTSQGVAPISVKVNPASFAIIKKLVNGTTYTFVIQTVTSIGTSIASEPVTVTPGNSVML